MILARLLYGKKIELVIDGTLVDIANVNRARTQKIRRVRGKVWWAKRRRKIVRRDNGMVVEFVEVRYGMLMMVLCDRGGRVYDVWISFGSVHEVRACRERKRRSLWFRKNLLYEDSCQEPKGSAFVPYVANLARAQDRIILEQAKEEATEIIKEDPSLENYKDLKNL